MHEPLKAVAVVFLTTLGLQPLGAQPASLAQATRFEESRVTTADGLRLYVRVVGNGPDTVIIGSVAYLANDLTPLQASRTLIFYDPRSRGGSDFVADSSRLGMSFEVADIDAVRSHFKISRFSLIGWSYLGAVVALYAAEHPQRVRAVVQIGPMAPRRATSRLSDKRGSPIDSASQAYVAQLQAAGVQTRDPVRYCREVVLRQMLRPMMGRPEMAERAKADPCMYWNEWPSQVFVTIRKVIPAVSGVNWDYTAQAKRITAPVLIVHGTNDPNAPIEGGRDWASVIPRARLIELKGIGHGPWLEAPEQFFPAVDAFLRAPQS